MHRKCRKTAVTEKLEIVKKAHHKNQKKRFTKIVWKLINSKATESTQRRAMRDTKYGGEVVIE